MKKRLNGKQIQEFENIKKTFSRFRLTRYENLARLWSPKTFPYQHKPRLYNEVTNDIIQIFEDIHIVFSHLPPSYQIKILAHRNFSDFLNKDVLDTLTKKELKEKIGEKPESYESFLIYQKLFTIGLEGLIKKMPSGFQNYLTSTITPLMGLMYSITNFYRSTTGKEDIPYPYSIPGTENIQI